MQASMGARQLMEAAQIVEYHTTQEGLETFLNITGKAWEAGKAVNASAVAAACALATFLQGNQAK